MPVALVPTAKHSVVQVLGGGESAKSAQRRAHCRLRASSLCECCSEVPGYVRAAASHEVEEAALIREAISEVAAVAEEAAFAREQISEESIQRAKVV